MVQSTAIMTRCLGSLAFSAAQRVLKCFAALINYSHARQLHFLSPCFLSLPTLGSLYPSSVGQASSLSDKDAKQGFGMFRAQRFGRSAWIVFRIPFFVDQDTGSYGRVNIVLPRPSRLYAPLQ